MRFLGHHRDELDEMIRKATGQSGEVHWLDFPYYGTPISGDGEWKGIECFKKHLENYKKIETEWKAFWPQSGNAMNWDGIFRIDDTWYFVEAKAHETECKSECGASSKTSIDTINKAFEKTIDWLGATPHTKWIESDCYQLANRLAFLYFCNQCGIKARLLYIGFVKGFRRKKDEVQTADRWMEIWKEEFEKLGLDIQNMTQHISFIHPNCDPKLDEQ